MPCPQTLAGGRADSTFKTEAGHGQAIGKRHRVASHCWVSIDLSKLKAKGAAPGKDARWASESCASRLPPPVGKSPPNGNLWSSGQHVLCSLLRGKGKSSGQTSGKGAPA
eukprot:997589-Amphidinium_carterae.1